MTTPTHAAPRNGWIRRHRLTSGLAALAVLAATAAGTAFGTGAFASTATPASVLTRDGYPVTMTLTHAQLVALAGSSGDGQLAAGFIDSGAVGDGSARGEMVLALTPSGEALFSSPAMIASMATSMGKGVTGYMTGGFLVLDGPASALTIGPAAVQAKPARPAAPAPAKTSPPAAPQQAAPAAPAPAAAPVTPAPAQFTNSVAVVDQFYQDITDRNYAAAWALGGDNIGGQDYASWVNGYATTASISLYDQSEFGSGQVRAYLSAVQADGTTRTYAGTYTVSGGVITGASITQTS